MKRVIFSCAICAALLATSCQNAADPVQPAGSSKSVAHLESGRLLVRVYWDHQGVAGKRVEVIELHRTATTDADGYAAFVLPIGDYTLRAYDINRGGPALRYIDTKFTITVGEETRVVVFDCLPCV